MAVSFLGYEFSLMGLLDRLFLFCLGLSASGWLTFLIAFGSNIFSIDPVVRAISFLYVPWWIAVFAGPAFFILAGLYYFLDQFTIGKFFGGASGFVAVIYVAALAAPMFAAASLLAGAVGAIDDVVDLIDVPVNLIRDAVNLAGDLPIFGRRSVRAIGVPSIPNPIPDIPDIPNPLDAVVEVLRNFIRGLLYFILVIFIQKYLTGVRGQFIGSFTSIFFLILAMMTWPFRHYKKGEKKKIC